MKVFLKTILILFVLSLNSAFSQINTSGTPFIKNYSSAEYRYHPNNFSITQDNRGIMYFGNAYGMLEFDGNNWKQMNLPSGKSAISLVKDRSGRICIGSVGEVGILEYNSSGQTFFTSLLNKLPAAHQNFEEVWKSFSIGDKVIYVTLSKILIYDGKKFEVLSTSDPEMVFDFSGEANGQLYLREAGKGLLQLKEGKLTLVKGGEYFASKPVYAILPHESGNLLVISTNGLEIYDGKIFKRMQSPLNDFFQRYPAAKAIRLNHKLYAVGTNKKGLILFDQQGMPLEIINKKNGLLSNNILDLYLDQEDNLWLATDNGISYVHTSSSFTSINEFANLPGMGYAAYIYANKLYLGTSQGLFYRNLKDDKNFIDSPNGFQPVKNAGEQIWYLGEAGGVLLCGDNRGLYKIEEDEAIKVSEGEYTGGWIFRNIKNEKTLVLGTYYGLEIYERESGGWKFKNRIKGFNESSRVLEVDQDNNIWICHGNKGLFKVRLNEKMDSAIEVKNIALLQGFEPNYFNDLTKVGDELIFASDNLLYKYNKQNNKLEKQNSLNDIIGYDNLFSRIGYHNDGNIWLVNNDAIEVLVFKGEGKYLKKTAPFKKLQGQLIGSFESFWKYNDQNYFIGTQNGFAHFNSEITNKNKAFNVLIRKVESINEGDSVWFGGVFLNETSLPALSQPSKQLAQIPFNQNALRFSYSALFYEDQGANLYQYYLEEVGSKNPGWSPWTNVTYKEYTNLSEADYKFRVRGRNIYGRISTETVYNFTVLPPWYRTFWAFIFYAILVFLSVAVVIRLVFRKIKKERDRIAREKEKEIILLKNEKLEAEVRYKNDELANLAINLSQKTEFLTQLKKDLVTINKEISPERNVSSISQLIKTIDKGIEFDDSWNHFQSSFDRIYHNFLFKIREAFPGLKPIDLLLCAYIKMNKTNKEISSLLNVSEYAVKKRRFRLKEKLKLDDETKLSEFLMDFKP